MDEVVKHSYYLPVSEELLADAVEVGDAVRRWMDATPEQRAEWEAEARAARARERAAAKHVELSLDTLLDKLGFSDAYAEHLVQPYCTCGDSADGWYRCPHADDEGAGP